MGVTRDELSSGSDSVVVADASVRIASPSASHLSGSRPSLAIGRITRHPLAADARFNPGLTLARVPFRHYTTRPI